MTRSELEELETKCESDVSQARRAYLKSSGWVESCDSPGSFWLWRRSWRGKDWTAATEFAVTLQNRIDALDNPADDVEDGEENG